jgi:hypothetical protein
MFGSPLRLSWSLIAQDEIPACLRVFDQVLDGSLPIAVVHYVVKNIQAKREVELLFKIERDNTSDFEISGLYGGGPARSRASAIAIGDGSTPLTSAPSEKKSSDSMHFNLMKRAT